MAGVGEGAGSKVHRAGLELVSATDHGIPVGPSDGKPPVCTGLREVTPHCRAWAIRGGGSSLELRVAVRGRIPFDGAAA